MLDLTYVRENADLVRQACKDKQLAPKVVDELLAAAKARQQHLTKVEKLRAQVNANAAAIKTSLKQTGGKPNPALVAKGKQLKATLKQATQELKKLTDAYTQAALQIPNIPAPDVPVGADETGNQVVRQEGERPQFDFDPKPHHELMLALDLLDVKRAVKIGGFRTYMLKNQAVILEQALLNYALGQMVAQGFTAISAPVLVNREAMVGTGYFPWGQQDHYYTQDEQILAGTAEVALTAFHGEEVLKEKDLPVKLVGISPCFRREVGTYGKDTQGIIRVHQFNKVEQVVLTVASEVETSRWHEQMLGYSERLLQDLELPYQVLLMCTGDMGACQRKKYDLESWFPAQGKYRETHSASYFNDFQARRLNMRYRARDGSLKYVYTLNNTMAASPRLLACIIENYQRSDGSLQVPRVLQPLCGFATIPSKV